MQRNIFLAVLMGTTFLTSPAFSQSRSGSNPTKSTTSEETIILKQNQPRTEIEIRNGNVYINGDKIATVRDGDEANVHKRIIIENNGTNGYSLHGFNGNDEKQEMPHRAILGVLTDGKSKDGGARILEVNAHSPAEEAGLKAGDLIVQVDDQKITDAAALTREVGTNHQAGDRVTITYERNGKTKTTTATLAKAPENDGNTRMFGFGNPGEVERNMPNHPFFREFRFPNDYNNDEENARPKIGVSVEDREEGHGVKVTGIAPGSAAAKGGIHTDDVITRVDDEAIESVASLQDKISSKQPGDKVTITYRRNGNTSSADLTLPRTINRKDL